MHETIEVEHRSGSDADFPWERLVNFVLGLWLFASAFLWPHTRHEQMDAWILGVLIAVTAAWGMFAHVIHYVNTIFAVWLVFSAFGAHHASAATLVNAIIVGVLVFVLSLIPNTWVVRLVSRRKSAAI